MMTQTSMERIYLQDLHVFGSLGVGSYGKVQLVRLSRNTHDFYALKTVRRNHKTQNEVDIISSLNSRFVVKFHRLFLTKNSSHILMEHCLGGDLLTLWEKNYSRVTPGAIQFYIACVVEAFTHIHGYRIIYRDLKLQNVLVDYRGYAKIGDFGLSKKLSSPSEITYSRTGTPMFFAPEVVLKKGYDISADYWSLGVLIFSLTAKYPPFFSTNKRETFDKIIEGFDYVDFPIHLFSIPVQDIVLKLCRMNPRDRLGFHRGFKNDDIRKQKWFRDFDWNALRNGSMSAPIIPELEEKSALVARCFNKKPEKVKEWDQF